MQFKSFPVLALVLICSWSSFHTPDASAHGSVVLGDDRCLININFLRAHFTVFQPETRANNEYCESIPDVSRSVFVMEYLHQLLPQMEIDFRIIEDEDKLGRYASWEDVSAIEDLDAVTVFYDPPRIEPGGYYQSSYTFDKRGTYIGVVTATHPTEDRDYNSVFYFRVGRPDYGTVPLFIALLILLQAGYWLSSGGLAKIKQRLGSAQTRS